MVQQRVLTFGILKLDDNVLLEEHVDLFDAGDGVHSCSSQGALKHLVVGGPVRRLLPVAVSGILLPSGWCNKRRNGCLLLSWHGMACIHKQNKLIR